MTENPPAVFHPNRSTYFAPPALPNVSRGLELPNVFHSQHYIKGDVEKGFEEAEIIVENRFSFDRVQHCQLEGHVANAWLEDDDGTLVVCHSTPGVHSDIVELQHLFGLPRAKIRVLAPYVGGAFRGKGFLGGVSSNRLKGSSTRAGDHTGGSPMLNSGRNSKKSVSARVRKNSADPCHRAKRISPDGPNRLVRGTNNDLRLAAKLPRPSRFRQRDVEALFEITEIAFTSLVPTQCIMMPAPPSDAKKEHDLISAHCRFLVESS